MGRSACRCPLPAYRCVRGTAPFWSLSGRSGQRSKSALTELVADDPIWTYSEFANEFMNAAIVFALRYIFMARKMGSFVESPSVQCTSEGPEVGLTNPFQHYANNIGSTILIPRIGVPAGWCDGPARKRPIYRRTLRGYGDRRRGPESTSSVSGGSRRKDRGP